MSFRNAYPFFVVCFLACALGIVGAASGLARSAEPVVRWEPAKPIQGTLFVVYVDGAQGGIRHVTGRAGGETLHFVPNDDRTFKALAAAPLDRGASLQLQVVVTYVDGREVTSDVVVPIDKGAYAMEQMERLTVAAEYVAPAGTPTPAEVALAERQKRELEKALAVSRLAHETPRLWQTVVLPRESRITSGFGSGREFNGRVQSRHTGVDFAGAVGAPVYAAADGIVALVDQFHLAGNVIYINHGAGLVTGYFHLSEALVAEGDQVGAGDLIGRVGATGRVTGPHLHWLVRYGAISVDGFSLVEVAQRLQ